MALVRVLPIRHLLPDQAILGRVLQTPRAGALPAPHEPALAAALEGIELRLDEFPRRLHQRLVPVLDPDVARALAAFDRAGVAGAGRVVRVGADVGRGGELADDHGELVVAAEEVGVGPFAGFFDVLVLVELGVGVYRKWSDQA